MSPLSVTLTIAIYFIVLFTVSYFAGRKADNAGFFTGNRRSSWYMVALAMIGASMSGVTYVSVPGMVATSSFGYLQMALGFTAGQLVIAYVLVPLFYRMNLTSIYEYLEERFGLRTYRTGAWFFFISKMLGAAVRLFLVCLTLQLLVFEPLHLPFVLNVVATVALVWLYTFRGGVKSLIWTDSLKTLCLIVSVVLCIVYIARDMGLTAGSMVSGAWDSACSMVRGMWNGITGFFSGIWNGIVSGVQSVGSRILQPFQSAISNIKGAFNGLVSFVQGIWDRITGIFSGIGNAVSGAIDAIGSILPFSLAANEVAQPVEAAAPVYRMARSIQPYSTVRPSGLAEPRADLARLSTSITRRPVVRLERVEHVTYEVNFNGLVGDGESVVRELRKLERSYDRKRGNV